MRNPGAVRTPGAVRPAKATKEAKGLVRPAPPGRAAARGAKRAYDGHNTGRPTATAARAGRLGMAPQPREVVPVYKTSRTPPRDEELHRRLVYGDESALGEVYDTFGALVHTVARRVTRSPSAAEDVAQEVFTQLWSRPYSFDPERGSLRAWLSMLAHRRAVDWVRGEEKHRKAALAEARTRRETISSEPEPEQAALDAQAALMLHDALAELPLTQRQAIHLAYFSGRTYRQVAVELGIPEGTAKTRLRTALRSLADRLADPPDPAVERGAR